MDHFLKFAYAFVTVALVAVIATGCGGKDPDGTDTAPQVGGEKVISCYEGKSNGDACWVRFEDDSVCMRNRTKGPRYIYTDCTGPAVPAGKNAVVETETETEHSSDNF